jgi:hypothetical protein
MELVAKINYLTSLWQWSQVRSGGIILLWQFETDYEMTNVTIRNWVSEVSHSLWAPDGNYQSDWMLLRYFIVLQKEHLLVNEKLTVIPYETETAS